MAEIRKFSFNDIGTWLSDTPNNWYITANDMLRVTAWCFLQLRKGNCIRNDKELSRFMATVEEWVEDHAVSMGREQESGTAESNS